MHASECLLLSEMCVDPSQQYEGMTDLAGGGMEEMYTSLSDGEIEEEPAYSDISSDENFLDSLNEEDLQQKLVRWCTYCVALLLNIFLL